MMLKLAALLGFALTCSVSASSAFAATECEMVMPRLKDDVPHGGCSAVKASAAQAAAKLPAAPKASVKTAETGNALSESVQRSASFVAKFKAGSRTGSPTMVLLHGSGGDENSLMTLAAKAYPGASLLGIRGRVVQEGINRWYKRLTPTTFDQDDVRSEAQAFAQFMTAAQKDYGIDLSRAIYLGYSNGANLLAAVSMLHPELVQRAALLRPMMVLNTLPDVNLAKDSILMVPGKSDTTYGPLAPGLEKALAEKGAKITEHTVDLGHLLGDADVNVVADWIRSIGSEKNGEAPTQTAAATNN
ncbi:alpha/beta hydrolase [Tianweitania sediminis]|uniref:Alpha/beta hydrolase n=1 Tax=Tianweitania sediminis TaxID=1502156 RepID=A0A8J7RIX0_9HYPH|nr:alpha/beta hydrolase [Tianweitania sediminis]MBP0439271.1 alpha/beta hydrolase [Tianweitania sediminis]